MSPRLLPILLLVALWLPAVQAGQVRVAVATNFSEPLAALAPLFQLARGHELVISSGSTGSLYAQIRNGAPYQALLAADRERPALLERQGLAVPGSRFTYAVGRLALWSAAADPSLRAHGPELLRQGDFRSLAIANPRLAPYGLAARQTLASLDLWQALEAKLVLGENIGQAYAMTATGNARLGFVALSQLLRPDSQASGYWEVPAHLHEPIEQQAVLLNQGAPDAAARDFLAFLRSPAARELIASYGYALP